MSGDGDNTGVLTVGDTAEQIYRMGINTSQIPKGIETLKDWHAFYFVEKYRRDDALPGHLPLQRHNLPARHVVVSCSPFAASPRAPLPSRPWPAA